MGLEFRFGLADILMKTTLKVAVAYFDESTKFDPTYFSNMERLGDYTIL